jgi:DNA-binding transcriptional LysR family regulator
MAANEVFDTHSQPLTHDLVANGVGYTIPPYCDIQSEIESRQLNGVRIRELTITWALAVNRVRAHTPAVRESTALIQRAAEARIK